MPDKNNLIIINHSVLQYYIYTNGNIVDRKIIDANIIKDYNMSSVLLKVNTFTITQSNRFVYYTQQNNNTTNLLALHPKILPILIDLNMIIKSDTLIDEDRVIVNNLFNIQQFIIVKHEYNKYIALADKYIVFYNVQYGNELVTYNIEKVMNMTTIAFSDFNEYMKIKEKYFSNKKYEWEQFFNLIDVCNRIFYINQTKIDNHVPKIDVIEKEINTNIQVKDKEVDNKEIQRTENNIINNIIEKPKFATVIKNIESVKSEKLIYNIDISHIIKVYKNLDRKKYLTTQLEYIHKYVEALKDRTNEREFNKLWIKKIDDNTKKITSKTILMFLFNDILSWKEKDIYEKFSSVLLRTYKLDRMLIQVFDAIAIDTVLLIYPNMKVFLFKSLNLFTWYYVRNRNGVEHTKETIEWIVKNDNIDISSEQKILSVNWFDVLLQYDLQTILIGSMYKKNLQLFFKEIFNINI